MHNDKTTSDLTAAFLAGKSEQSIELFHYFVATYRKLGADGLYPTKSMIGIAKGDTRVAWITRLGKHFIHVVLPFTEPHPDNLCFQKIVQVPGQQQFNHHLRIQHQADLNDEVLHFMAMTLNP